MIKYFSLSLKRADLQQLIQYTPMNQGNIPLYRIMLNYSNCTHSTIEQDVFSLSTKLQEDDPLPIDIRRDSVLKDAMREAKKQKFTVKKQLKADNYHKNVYICDINCRSLLLGKVLLIMVVLGENFSDC